MPRRLTSIWLPLLILCFCACGPDTIFLRPSLDTPQHHVKNGQCLLDQGKIEAAYNEFLRAKKLDDRYIPAYVGLALAHGKRGDISVGMKTLEQAKSMAVDQAEMDAVNEGMVRLREIQAGE